MHDNILVRCTTAPLRAVSSQ